MCVISNTFYFKISIFIIWIKNRIDFKNVKKLFFITDLIK